MVRTRIDKPITNTRMRVVKHGRDQPVRQLIIYNSVPNGTNGRTHSTTLPNLYITYILYSSIPTPHSPKTNNQLRCTLDVPSPMAAIAMSPACLSHES